MTRPGGLSGFPELLPQQRYVELDVIARLVRTFELHGFAPVETRAAEPLDQLLRKGEIDNEVYTLHRLQGDEDQTASLGLHYDLTVPFARYVIDNAGHLEFPFRRYQIQKVWRGERPQEGRYREFTQADIDVVGRDVLPLHHDVAVARVMAEALVSLDFLPPIRLQVNNRRLIEGFYLGLGVIDPPRVMQAVDKLDKLPAEQVAATLRDEIGLSGEQAELALALATIRSPDGGFVERVRSLDVSHELLDQGLAELAAVIDGCADIASDRVTVEADLSVARGLNYYTGTVFETRMAGFERLGSICSGGRYESLAFHPKTTYPGVGISFGLTRTLIPLLMRGDLVASRAVPSAVLVALVDEPSRARCEGIAAALRRRGIAVEVAESPQKFGRQIRYAERRGIPFVWFPASDATEGAVDQVRDIRTGEQAAANADSWDPPTNDLRPRTVSTLTKEETP